MKTGIRIKTKALGLTLLLANFLPGAPAEASERVHAFSYSSAVLPVGSVELEPWIGARVGRDGYYLRLDSRLELEVGLARGLQTALYLNTRATSQDDGRGGLSTSTLAGFSSEWKVQVSDPVADALGLGFYWEWSVWPHETEFEAKILLDKALGPAYLVLNLTGEVELKPVPKGRPETEESVELLLGFSGQVSKVLSLGVELREAVKWEGAVLESAVLSAGPAIALRGARAWGVLTILPQLVDLKTGKRNTEGAENLEARFVLGVSL